MGEEILGIFPATFSRFNILSKWRCKLVFTTSRLIVAKYKASLSERLFGGYAYNFLQASARDRMKMQKVSAEPYLEGDPENFEISYSDITVVEHEILPAEVLLKIFIDDLDIPNYAFTLYVKESYAGEIKEFFNKVLPAGKV